jgi:hypothetical protein
MAIRACRSYEFFLGETVYGGGIETPVENLRGILPTSIHRHPTTEVLIDKYSRPLENNELSIKIPQVERPPNPSPEQHRRRKEAEESWRRAEAEVLTRRAEAAKHKN